MAGEIFQVTNLTDHFVGEKVRGSQGIKWPKAYYGVVALLGEVKRDGSEKFDVDAAMAELGWQRIQDGSAPVAANSAATRPMSPAQASSSQPVDALTDTGGSDQDNRPLADRWELKPETKPEP